MKKLFLTLIGIVILFSTTLGQSFIGETKKDVMKQLKPTAISIAKPEKIDSGYYSIKVTFQNSTNWYSFTKNDICYFYIVTQQLNTDLWYWIINDYDNKYLRSFDKNNEVWKEPKGGTFVYRWMIRDINKNVLYILFLTQENYENHKYDYLRMLLGS